MDIFMAKMIEENYAKRKLFYMTMKIKLVCFFFMVWEVFCLILIKVMNCVFI